MMAADMFDRPKNTRRCAQCGKDGEIGQVVPFGAGKQHIWLHHACWEAHENAGICVI